MSGGWDGAGNFSLSVDMSVNAAAGVPIIAAAFSNQTDELKTGINACLTKNGENTPSADLPMATKKHANVGKAVTLTNYLRANEFIQQSPVFMSDQDSISSVSISCSTLYFPASATAGTFVRIKMAGNKPQTVPANVQMIINGVTMSAVMPDGGKIMQGALLSGHVHDFVHDGTVARLMNPYVSLKKYSVPLRIRNASHASVTINGSTTVDFFGGRSGDVVYIGMEVHPTNTLTFSCSVSTGSYAFWSAPPAELLSESLTVQGLQSGAYGQVWIATSSDIDAVVYPAKIERFGTGYRFKPFNNPTANLGHQITFYGFMATLPKRKI